jgi:hypothetical protein
MTQQVLVAAVAPSSPSWSLTESVGARPLPASPQAVQRFEQLLYAPTSGRVPGELQLTTTTKARGMQMYVEHLSQRWESGQTAIRKILSNDKVTASDLVRTQLQMINCAIDLEVSSKCASIVENGVQTLVQRGGA